MNDVLFIGDPHFAGTGPERNGPLATFLRFLDSLRPPDVAAVCMLGDVFEMWLGPQRFHDEGPKAFLAAVAAAKERGVAVDLVEGNRDILAHKLNGTALREVAEVAHYQLPGANVRAIHGDLVNYKDAQYLKWRRFVRGRMVRALGWASPRFVLLPAARHVERKLRRTNEAYKVRFPEKLAAQAVSTAGDQGVDILVVGHFHLKRLMPDPSGCMGIFVPMFTRNGEYLRVRGDGSYAFERYEG